MRRLPSSKEVRMSESETDRKRELACLRLASELTQLATELPDRDLKARCLRMAGLWTDQAEQGPGPVTFRFGVSYH
jgi:hypothetical protein